MARDPHPAARSVHPLTPNPHGSCSRRHKPASRYPYVVGSGPAPVAGRPHVSRAGDRRLRFNANCWRSPGHYDLPGRTRRRNLLRSCRCCHCSWLLSAADKRQWHQRQYINTDSHMYASVCRFVLDQRIGFVRTGNSDSFSTTSDGGKRILIR